MFDVMADWLTVPLLNHEGGKPPKRLGLAHPSIAPYGVFRTRDGSDILISIQSDREWAKFCEHVLERPEMATADEFATNLARVANRDGQQTARCGPSSARSMLLRRDAGS